MGILYGPSMNIDAYPELRILPFLKVFSARKVFFIDTRGKFAFLPEPPAIETRHMSRSVRIW